jgi:SAM-dependent methyltransferase
MNDDIRDIAAYYNDDPQREHSRLERHQLEHDLTWRYLDRYLPAEGSILEVGCATGRYTLELAKRGYHLTAIDLSAMNVELCAKRLADVGLENRVRLLVADARDLSAVTARDFDVVLLMGPLYHLVIEADRKSAVKQAFERLREGGILFSSFISRFGIMGDLVRNTPDWIEDQVEVQSLLETGKRPDHYARDGVGFRGYFVQVSEIAPLHEVVGFETLTMAGVEPAISADDESYNKLQGTQRQLWMDLFYQISTERSILGASRHLLYVGRKNHG